jgi:hypothetical protein
LQIDVNTYFRIKNEAIFSQPYIKPKIIGKVLCRSSLTTLSKRMEELVAAKILAPKKVALKCPTLMMTL